MCKRWTLCGMVLLLLLCLASCAQQRETAGVLWSGSTEDMALYPERGLCAAGETLVIGGEAGLAYFRPRETAAPLACALPDGETYRLVGGDGVYALSQQNELFAVEQGTDSVTLRLAGRIAADAGAGYLSKAAVGGEWLTALYWTDPGAADTFACYSFPLDGGEAVLVEQDGVMDLCAYEGGKVLLLCREESSLTLRVLDPASAQQRVLATLEDTEGAGVAYYPATDSVYLARPGGLWRVNRQGKAEQAGYLAWTQMPWDASAAVTEDGCYALCGRGQLLIYDLHLPAESIAALTVACPMFDIYCREAMDVYQQENPSLNVTVTSYDTMTGEEYLQRIYTDGAADIIGSDQPELLDAMIQKGYCADLSESSVIAAMTARMDPRLTERFCRDGKIYGVPYYAELSSLIPAYQPEIADWLGISREELPSDWLSLMDFLENWADDPRLEAENISLLSCATPVLSFRDALISAITEQQLAYCVQQGLPLTLDTPEFRALLERVEALSPLLAELEERNRALSMAAGEQRCLLLLGYSMLTGDGDQAKNRGCQLLPLSWTADTAMLYPINQGLLIVNAGSPQAEEAIRLVEALLTGLTSQSRAILMPDDRAPVEYAGYRSSQEEFAAGEASYQARYDACTDAAERREIQSAWERYRDSWASSLAMRYEITQESIQNLNRAQSGMVCAGYDLFYRQADETISMLYSRYLWQEITTEQFLGDVERILEMRRLEQQ